MRWVSNKESVRKGEPSVLAIVETLTAMGLSLWIAVQFGTVRHVVTPSSARPAASVRVPAAITSDALRELAVSR